MLENKRSFIHVDQNRVYITKSGIEYVEDKIPL